MSDTSGQTQIPVLDSSGNTLKDSAGNLLFTVLSLLTLLQAEVATVITQAQALSSNVSGKHLTVGQIQTQLNAIVAQLNTVAIQLKQL